MKFYIIILAIMFFWGIPVLAVDPPAPASYDPKEIEILYDPLKDQEVQPFVGGVIKQVLSVVGSIALVLFIYGGVKWMLARGDANEVGAAQKIMLWTGLGLAVIFSSYIILQLIFETLKK